MFDFDSLFSQLSRSVIHDTVVTILFSLTIFGMRTGLCKAILTRDLLETEFKLRLVVNIRNIALLIFLMGIPLIWGHQLGNIAVSMMAIAAAFVLATKEVLLCILGALYRTSINLYKTGDRVEIVGIRGQIIDMNLLSTTLIESSQATLSGTVGRSITIPNSLLFTQALHNETMLGDFVTQVVHISIGRDDDWGLAEKILLESSNTIISEYADELAIHTKKLTRGLGLQAQLQHPQVRILIDNIHHLTLHLQLPAPLGHRSRIEQRILREFLLHMPLKPHRNLRLHYDQNQLL